ncbi:MAG: geranylgeranylglycerol-phosphate geranylgeranyltransferase [Salibacteraceae bacterium]
MVKFMAYMRLVRLPILVLIAFIQFNVRHFLIEPMLVINGYKLIMSDMHFSLLVLATIFIAAGGYAINDYFDVKVDRINKLKQVIIDRHIKRRVAMMLHILLTATGFMLASYVSWKLGMWKITALFIFAIFTLWFYSTSLKHQFLSGNLAIALMASFVPLIVGLFEIPLQNQAHPESIQELGYSIFNVPAFWVIGYAIILFLLTLIREITKDVIDLRGDRIYGSKTIPIQTGIKTTKYILIGLYAAFGAIFSWFYFDYLSVHTGMTTLFFIVALLLVFEIILIIRARTKPHFLYSANLNNLITLLIILSTYFIKVSIETYFM